LIAFIWESPLLQLILALSVLFASLLAGIKWSYIRTFLLVLTPFYLILLLTHTFFNRAQVMNLLGTSTLTPIFTFPENWWLIGGGYASWEGLFYGLNLVFKTLTLTLIIPLGVFTTEINNMIVGLVKLRIPYKIAFAFSSTLRFFPLLIQEFISINQTQRLRGLDIDQMKLIQRVRVYAKVAVPLILRALVKSQQLEIVLQSKAFSGSADRTYLHDSILGPLDYTLIAAIFTLFIMALALLILYGIGSYGGPI
jgi:energy-coupling factor transport system permease protein